MAALLPYRPTSGSRAAQCVQRQEPKCGPTQRLYWTATEQLQYRREHDCHGVVPSAPWRLKPARTVSAVRLYVTSLICRPGRRKRKQKKQGTVILYMPEMQRDIGGSFSRATSSGKNVESFSNGRWAECVENLCIAPCCVRGSNWKRSSITRTPH